MRWEKLDIIGVTVHDMDAAVRLYEQLFGIRLEQWSFPDQVDVTSFPLENASSSNLDLARSNRVAMDRTGLFELVEDPAVPAGMRSIHFKVDDLDAAGAELVAEGLRLVARYRVGGLEEAVYEGPTMPGVRLSLITYEGDDIVEAIAPRALPST